MIDGSNWQNHGPFLMGTNGIPQLYIGVCACRRDQKMNRRNTEIIENVNPVRKFIAPTVHNIFRVG